MDPDEKGAFCFTDALNPAQLLFEGEDFSHTDITPALM
jgi:uncharacterized protein with PIN domain